MYVCVYLHTVPEKLKRLNFYIEMYIQEMYTQEQDANTPAGGAVHPAQRLGSIRLTLQ